jgi:mRNA-degrading endonuclease YafQ of YafQ-DinJ toxin-antitoxin module
MKKRGKDINKLKDIISLLQQGKELPLQNRDHA